MGLILETSSEFDIVLIERLLKAGKINKKEIIVNNGYKTRAYAEKIVGLIKNGFKNVIPVLDNMEEIDLYEDLVDENCKLGIRVATEEEPNFCFLYLSLRYSVLPSHSFLSGEDSR